MLREVGSFLHHLRGGDARRWRPLLALHYVTYACRMRCPYCSDGAQQPYHTLREQPLDAAGTLALLARVRDFCGHLVLTGGEPLQHPEFSAILAGLPALRFRSLALTTNGLGVELHLEALARCVTDLVVSVDTLDETKADAWRGLGPGTHRRVLSALDAARKHPGRRYRLIVSAVATPENLDDLPELYSWCRAEGHTFALAPQLVGRTAHPALAGDARYRTLFERLAQDRRRGEAIHGTPRYLEAMRDLAPFRCRPLTLLVTSPNGQVFYPCLELGTQAGSLLDAPDLDTLRAMGEAVHGPLPDCGTCCHSACALGFATLIDHPVELLGEIRRGWKRA